MKKFKHLFAALAIVLVALSVSGCKDGLHSDQLFVSVELHLSNPSGKKIHCEYAIDQSGGDSGYGLVDNKHIALVYIIAGGLHTNYSFTKEIRNQASGSVDFELDDETDYVEVEVRVLMTDKSPFVQKIYSRRSTIKID